METKLNTIGKTEREIQNRIIQLFQTELNYTYLGNWEVQQRTQPFEKNMLLHFLTRTHGYSKGVVYKAIDKLIKAANINDAFTVMNDIAYLWLITIRGIRQ